MAKINKVAYEFVPFTKTGIKKRDVKNKSSALRKVAEFVKVEVLKRVGDGSSPVKEGKWVRDLRPGYKKRKGKISGVTFSNLELEGELLDALEVKKVSENRLSLQVEGSQAGKADGNNRGTYGKGGGTRSRRREFIPRSGQTLDDDIWSGVRDILKEHKE